MECSIIDPSRYQQYESAVMNDRISTISFQQHRLSSRLSFCTVERVLSAVLTCHGVGEKGRLDHNASGPSKPKPAAKKPRHGPQGLECALDVVTRHAKGQDGRPVEVPDPTPPATSVLLCRTVTAPQYRARMPECQQNLLGRTQPLDPCYSMIPCSCLPGGMADMDALMHSVGWCAAGGEAA